MERTTERIKYTLCLYYIVKEKGNSWRVLGLSEPVTYSTLWLCETDTLYYITQ